jgi:hypothetical protein
MLLYSSKEFLRKSGIVPYGKLKNPRRKLPYLPGQSPQSIIKKLKSRKFPNIKG